MQANQPSYDAADWNNDPAERAKFRKLTKSISWNEWFHMTSLNFANMGVYECCYGYQTREKYFPEEH
jgi:hypothetical protein